MRTLPGLVLFAALTGCDVNVPGLHARAPEGPIAVGALTGAGIEDCDAVRITKYSGCDGASVERYEFSEPGIFELVEPGLLRAVKEGRTTLKMYARSGGSVSAEIVAKDIDALKVGMEALPSALCSEAGARLVPVGEPRKIFVTLFGDGEVLGGELDATTVVEVSEGSSLSNPSAPRFTRELILNLRTTPGEARVTSRIDPTVDFRLTAYDFSTLERLELESVSAVPWRTPEVVGGAYPRAQLRVAAVVAGERTCGHAFPMLAKTGTPGVCKLIDERLISKAVDSVDFVGERFEAWPLDAGTCVLTTELVDGGFSSTRQFVVP